MPSYNFDIF